MLFKTLLYFIFQHRVLITFSEGTQLTTFLVKRRNSFRQAEVEKLHVKNLCDIHILKNL